MRATCRGMAVFAALLALGSLAPVRALGLGQASQPAASGFPFEGTWIRADRICTAKSTLVRTYTAHEVTSSRNRCSIRRIAGGYGSFELFEECHHAPNRVTETIRMSSPDTMVLKRQIVRLKIPRAVRFARCSAAGPQSAAPKPPPATPPKPPLAAPKK